MQDGGVLWRRNLRADFHCPAELPWGYCGSPVVADGKLIVQAGGENASLVALDLADGSLIWQTPGGPPGYGSLIVGEFGNRRQIVGHDAATLGGWDLATGERLWTLTPDVPGDFNVPTPLAAAGRLLIATENNGTRLYRFRDDGTIDPRPAASSNRLRPDMSTPVVVGSRVFCIHRLLYCLDLDDGLNECYRQRDAALSDYGAIIADDERLLLIGKGELLLADARSRAFRIISRLRVFDEPHEIFSHPALVGDRLYLRGERSLICLELK